MDSSDSGMPGWVLAARRFIATGRQEFLARAIGSCADVSVREFLSCRELALGLQVSPEVLGPIAESLRSGGRQAEAAAVILLGLRREAMMAASPMQLDSEKREFTERMCRCAVSWSREAGFAECEATFAFILGTLALELREYRDSYAILNHSLTLSRELARFEPGIYEPHVCSTLVNLVILHAKTRQFPQAQAACKEAMAILHRLESHDRARYRPRAATALTNLGYVLGQVHQPLEAQAACEEALSIYNDLPSREMAACQPLVATTLNNLGNIFQELGQFPRARAAYEKALEIRRDLARHDPGSYRAGVATTLNNLGNVLLELDEFDEAERRYQEALEIRRDLVTCQGDVFRSDLAQTLNHMGNLLERAGDDEQAVEVSRQAIEAAESAGGVPAHRHLAKGQAEGAYLRVLAKLANGGDPAATFRCLAAMREGAVMAFGDAPEHGLSVAGEQLHQLGQQVGQPVKVLVVEAFPGTGLLAAILDSQPPYLVVSRCDAFREAGEALCHEIEAAPYRGDKKTASASNALIRRLAEDAWRSLPECIRGVLDPLEDHQVLISGDAYWTMFPWEGICLGEGEEDFLGLRRPLGRWGPLTGPAMAGLRRAHFGGGQRTAAVIAPWDTDLTHPLRATAVEADLVRQSLPRLGYELRPEGGFWLGTAATTAAMDTVLGDPPAVIHFTGHGGIDGNEEVMLLWDSVREHEVSRYGRAQFEQVKAARGRPDGKLLVNGPLVVLNSCVTGRAREHGGKREDLASAFMAEGAAAVIASPFPISEGVGVALGTDLYGQDDDGIGEAVLRIRRHLAATVCAEDPRLWPAWMLIACHGNPYACCPHQSLNGNCTDG